MPDNIDQLENDLIVTTNPKERIELLNQLAERLRTSDIQRGINLAKEAYQLSKSDQFEPSPYQKGLADSQVNLGRLYHELADYNTALDHTVEALNLYQQLNDNQGQCKAYNIFGLINLRLGDYSEALHNHLEGLKLAEMADDTSLKAKQLLCLGLVYWYSGSYQQALAHYEKSLPLYQDISDLTGEAAILNNCCGVHCQLGNYDLAISYGMQGVTLCRQIEDEYHEALTQDSLGETYLVWGKYEQAIEHFYIGLDIARKMGLPFTEMIISRNLGKTYFHQANYDLALNYLNQAVNLAEAFNTKQELFQCYQTLASLYEAKGQFEQALIFHKKFHDTKEQVFNENADLRLKNLEVRYRTEAKAQEVEIERLKTATLEQELEERKRAELLLQQMQEELEKQVQHRTTKLSETNSLLETHIAERKRIEMALRESEMRYRLIFEQGPLAVTLIDLDLKYIKVNQRMCDIIGYEKAELYQLTFTSITHPEDRDLDFGLAQQLIENKISHYQIEKRFIHKSGRCIWGRLTATFIRDHEKNPLYGLGLIEDITEQKQAEGVLRQYSERLEILRDIDNAILTAQSPKEIAQAVVQHICKLMPCDRVSVVIFNDDTQEGEVLAVHEKIQTNLGVGQHIPIDRFGITNTLKMGQSHVVNDFTSLSQPSPIIQTLQKVGLLAYISTPLMVQDQLIGMISVGSTQPNVFTSDHIESTCLVAAPLAIAMQQARLYEQVQTQAQELERRVAERTAQLEAAQQELIQQERLATLGQLTATVSHELRNPLATLRTSLYSIDSKVRDKGLGVERALDRLDRNITRCDNIIGELLDYTRMPRIKLAYTDLDAWLIDLSQNHPIPPEISLNLDLQSQAKVALDPDRFQRVMINLMDNAIQAMLSLNENIRQLTLTIQSTIEQGQAKIRVIDTGSGIPTEVLPQIFEPLFSTKGFGVGLGLTVVKEIVEQHQGDIKITSEPGQGTEVTLWLTLANEE